MLLMKCDSVWVCRCAAWTRDLYDWFLEGAIASSVVKVGVSHNLSEVMSTLHSAT